MRQDTAIVIAKGICYVFIGFTAPLSTALSQWSNEGTWPPRINCAAILGTCLGSAAASLLAYLSGSYSDYLSKRSGNGNTSQFTKPAP